jgi:hypothetical protein
MSQGKAHTLKEVVEEDGSSSVKVNLVEDLVE